MTPATWNCSLPVPLQSTTGRFCKVGKGCASAVHWPAGSLATVEAVAPVRVCFQTRWALTSLGLFDLSGPLTSLGLDRPSGL